MTFSVKVAGKVPYAQIQRAKLITEAVSREMSILETFIAQKAQRPMPVGRRR